MRGPSETLFDISREKNRLRMSDSFDPRQVARRLNRFGWVFHPTIDSTQSAAKRRLASGTTLLPNVEANQGKISDDQGARIFLSTTPQAQNPPTVIVTNEQTAGRGRGMRTWFSGAGSLTFTIIVPLADPTAAIPSIPQASLAAGLAVCEALGMLLLPLHDHANSLDDTISTAFLLEAGLVVKWPNDVYLRGKKISGLLGEVVFHPVAEHRDESDLPTDSQRIAARSPNASLLIGIGVNINTDFASAPVSVQEKSTSLAITRGQSFDLTEALTTIVAQVVARVASVIGASGDESWPIMHKRLSDLDGLRDRIVSIRTRMVDEGVHVPCSQSETSQAGEVQHTIRGQAVGLSPSGALRLAIKNQEFDQDRHSETIVDVVSGEIVDIVPPLSAQYMIASAGS